MGWLSSTFHTPGAPYSQYSLFTKTGTTKCTYLLYFCNKKMLPVINSPHYFQGFPLAFTRRLQINQIMYLHRLGIVNHRPFISSTTLVKHRNKRSLNTQIKNKPPTAFYKQIKMFIFNKQLIYVNIVVWHLPFWKKTAGFDKEEKKSQG